MKFCAIRVLIIIYCNLLLLYLFHCIPTLYAEVKSTKMVPMGATGLASTLNPMLKNNNNSNNSSNVPAAGASNNNNTNSNNNSRKPSVAPPLQKLVLVKGIFLVDPKLSFMPDWM